MVHRAWNPMSETATKLPRVIRLVRPASGQTGEIPAKPPRLLDQVRQSLRARHYSARTEKAYVAWIRRFILFHGSGIPNPWRSPRSAPTCPVWPRQRSARRRRTRPWPRCFSYISRCWGANCNGLGNLVHAKRPKHVPVVLGREEVRLVLARLDGSPWLVSALLYGGGLRLLEALRLRVKDLDLDRREIVIRRGKGQKDRRTVLPNVLVERFAFPSSVRQGTA